MTAVMGERVTEHGRRTVTATPFVWREPAAVERRSFVYGYHYARRFLSTTVAPGGVGKSSLVIVEALAMVTGRALLGRLPRNPVKVWIWNGEDPLEELERRVIAAMIHFAIDPAEVEGRLFLDSGRTMEIVIASTARSGGAEVDRKMVEAVGATIMLNGIDVVIIDPFVSSHRVVENDNMAVDAVAKAWGKIADATNCAVELVHHARKSGGSEITVEDGRGASALLAAARSARTLNPMNKTEAGMAGIETPRGYFRVDNGKSNLAPPPERADWFKLASVPLGNGDPANMIDEGDKVAVVTQWEFPDALAGVSVENLRDAQRAVAAGGPWRENSQAKNWVGRPIAAAMKLDPDKPADKAKVKVAFKTWLATGTFVIVTGKDEKRRDKAFVEVGEWASD